MNHRFIANFFDLMQDTINQVKLAANSCFPSYIRRPDPRRKLLEDIRKSDPEQNAKSAPPEDEYIDLCSIWAVEFYTPAYMDDLLNSMERLGWNEDESRSPVGSLKNRDGSQFSQMWIPLGPVLPRNAPNPYMTDPLRADLPPNVQYAYGDIYCFTPSLIAITFEFVFDKEYSRIFDDALRQDRETYLTATRRGYTIHDPASQRTTHIKKTRIDTTQYATDWFSNNLPGLCSSGLLESEFPTCEFVTLRKVKPFPSKEEHDGEFQSYLWHLGLSHSYGSWESTDMPGLRFYSPSGDRNIAKYHSILSINEGTWIKQDCREEYRSGRESRINSMHRRVSGILGIWAIGALLQGYARHFRELRNSQFLRSRQTKSAVEALQRIVESMSYSVDIAAVTAELASFVRIKRPLGFEVESFNPRSDAPHFWWKGNLEQLIQKQIGEKAEWLRSMDNAMRDQLTQYGTILGMVEDIRLQKKITTLTFAILVLTIVLATMTFITVFKSFPWVQTMLNSLGDLFQMLRFV